MRIYPSEMPDLTPDDTRALIAYARRKFAEERWPLSPELRRSRNRCRRLSGCTASVR
jgi:hypothetical protein